MIDLNFKDPTPIYIQLANRMKKMIDDGFYNTNEKLPSVRELSKELTINPNTVVKAYKLLEDDDIINVRQGKGAFINENYLQSLKSTNEKHFEEIIIELIKLSKSLNISMNVLIEKLTELWKNN